MTDLNRLSAAESARRIAAGKLTSEALVDACLERLKARDTHVAAWVHCESEATLAQAGARLWALRWWVRLEVEGVRARSAAPG